MQNSSILNTELEGEGENYAPATETLLFGLNQLTFSARWLYLQMCFLAGAGTRCYETLEELAQGLDLSNRQTATLLDKLADAGLIEAQQELERGRGGRTKTLSYYHINKFPIKSRGVGNRNTNISSRSRTNLRVITAHGQTVPQPSAASVCVPDLEENFQNLEKNFQNPCSKDPHELIHESVCVNPSKNLQKDEDVKHQQSYISQQSESILTNDSSSVASNQSLTRIGDTSSEPDPTQPACDLAIADLASTKNTDNNNKSTSSKQNPNTNRPSDEPQSFLRGELSQEQLEILKMLEKADIAYEDAQYLARVTSHTKEQVSQVITLVTDPGIEQKVWHPTGLIFRAVEHSYIPSIRSKSNKATSSHNRASSSARISSKGLNQPSQPIDFKKYTTGKYAYLTRPNEATTTYRDEEAYLDPDNVLPDEEVRIDYSTINTKPDQDELITESAVLTTFDRQIKYTIREFDLDVFNRLRKVRVQGEILYVSFNQGGQIDSAKWLHYLSVFGIKTIKVEN